jgi:hypothetical protein
MQWIAVEKMFGVRALCEYENYSNQNYSDQTTGCSNMILCDQAHIDADP